MDTRKRDYILGYLFGFAVLLFIIAQTVIFASFFMPFFEWQFQRPREYWPYNGRNAVQVIGIEKDELMRVTTELLDYMRGRRDTLDGIQAVVMGENREFFSDLEKRHMVDVRVLYDWVFRTRRFSISFIITTLIILALIKKDLFFYLPRFSTKEETVRFFSYTMLTGTRNVIVGFLSVAAIVTVAIATDFDRAWMIFHLIFFNNDYWILQHRVDLLLDMVSLSFFAHISILVGSIMLLAFLAVIAITSVLLRKNTIPQKNQFPAGEKQVNNLADASGNKKNGDKK